ncbi:MAG: 2Fe-2S iron-sulfur cluster binding domain-containing protein [Myxococcales bacterium]|nr:2Fe-2S iron-sulfur cluster binding domain-containing protein [Myxococcales bacterium]
MPKVTFLPDGNSIDVPAGTSLLHAAQKGHAQVGFACGGNCACSTCHVYVRKGYDSLTDVAENEDDILDRAFDVQPVSRLACQAKLGDEDVECEITRESRQAWFDEHPDERARQKNG